MADLACQGLWVIPHPLAGPGHRDHISREGWEKRGALGKDGEDPVYSYELQTKNKDGRKEKQEKKGHRKRKAGSDKQELPQQEAEGEPLPHSRPVPAVRGSSSTWPGPFPSWPLLCGRETLSLALGDVGNHEAPCSAS